MIRVSDWKALPFREIWVVDTEFYPGLGLANGGREGDAATVCCVVARELRSGRLIRLWQDALGRFPPYRLDGDALFIAFANAAELGCHIALGWGQPARSIDAYVEFRHLTNDGAVKAADREKGFYGLAGALRYFGVDGIDTAHKKDMRERILQGPPFTDAEKRDILDYCQSDVDGLARLVPHLIPTIRSLPHAMLRAEYQWPMAQQERRGIPTNLSLVDRIRGHWDDIKLEIAREKDRFGLCEIVDGVVHMPEHRIQDFLKRNNMAWPTRETDGKPDLRDQTFRDMMGRYPEIGPIREMRATLSKFRLNELAIGADGRNRTPLWAYGTKTGRNAPSNSRYIFGPAKWVRFLISPPPGRVLVYRDFMQQEVRIAAIKSGDGNLLEACESGDVYIGIATQLGFYHDGMSKAEHDAVRVMFKVVVLGIQYGMAHRALALRTGRSLYEAAEILARLKARFRKFEDYSTSVVDRAGLDMEISTPFGWTMQCPPHIQQRIVRNFPIQSTGSEILHVACILAERRGVELVAPIHDALMAEANAAHAEDTKHALDRLMRDASAIVLKGYELPSDFQVVHAGGSFYDKNGKDLWDTITNLVARLDARKGAPQ